MLCVVHPQLGGWHGTIVSHDDDEHDPPADEWIVETMRQAIAFQLIRGGGVFLAIVPEEALR